MKTFKDEPITVVGDTKKVGDLAPNFKALTVENQFVTLDSYQSKYIVLNVVPSLDTSVCDFQTHMINEKLSKVPNLTVLTISNDLPFAQARWCGNSNLDHVITLSDYRLLDFALKYGTLIEELRLQARSVFVLDEKRTIIYLEYLDEMSHHPNYDALLEFISKLPKG